MRSNDITIRFLYDEKTKRVLQAYTCGEMLDFIYDDVDSSIMCDHYIHNDKSKMIRDDNFARKQVTVTYDSDGRVSGMSFNNDISFVIYFSYNDEGNVKEIEYRSTKLIGVSMLMSIHFIFGSNGNITTRIETNGLNIYVTEYSYYPDSDIVKQTFKFNQNKAISEWYEQKWYNQNGDILYTVNVDHADIKSVKYIYEYDRVRTETLQLDSKERSDIQYFFSNKCIH